jgi:hypothetical protein
MKVGRSQGKGIFLVNSTRQVKQWKAQVQREMAEALENVKDENSTETCSDYIVQQYIENPLLLFSKL